MSYHSGRETKRVSKKVLRQQAIDRSKREQRQEKAEHFNEVFPEPDYESGRLLDYLPSRLM